MKNFLIAIFALSASTSAFANSTECLDAHMSRAARMAYPNFGPVDTDISQDGAKLTGGYWVALGVYAATLSIGATPVIGTAAIGATILTVSIIQSVREPRYRLLLAILGNGPEAEIEGSHVFKKMLARAQEIKAGITAIELKQRFIDGIDSGKFCTETNKPYNFKTMEKAVLSNL